jgi:hypothetical protein
MYDLTAAMTVPAWLAFAVPAAFIAGMFLGLWVKRGDYDDGRDDGYAEGWEAAPYPRSCEHCESDRMKEVPDGSGLDPELPDWTDAQLRALRDDEHECPDPETMNGMQIWEHDHLYHRTRLADDGPTGRPISLLTDLCGIEDKRPPVRPAHRLRDDPFPDEMDQEFCEEDQTLCMPGRPCMCCYIGDEEASETTGPFAITDLDGLDPRIAVCLDLPGPELTGVSDRKGLHPARAGELYRQFTDLPMATAAELEQEWSWGLVAYQIVELRKFLDSDAWDIKVAA